MDDKKRRELLECVDAFYTAYIEFHKKCGSTDMAIRMTCAMFGVNVPETNSIGFLFGGTGNGARNGRK